MNKQKYKKFLDRKINESRNKLYKYIDNRLKIIKETIWKDWEDWIGKKGV